MKFWLLENGEKSGPHESFVIRERVEAGELERDVLAWYQGADAWMPLGDVAQFETLFLEKESELVLPPPIPEEALNKNDQLKRAIEKELAKAPPIHATRRLFARLHDWSLYTLLVYIIFQERVVQMTSSESMLPFLGIGITYVLLDGIWTHVWRTSPGKFILGMRITDAVGHAIPLPFAIMRSLRVWILGMGMGLVMPIAVAFSWLLSRKFGYFLWDIPKRYRVVVRPFSGMHVMAYLASYMFMVMAFSAWVPAEVILDSQPPEVREWLEKLNAPSE